MTCGHDLFRDQPNPSSTILLDWLERHGVFVSDGVEIRPSPSGGWGVFASRDLDPDELILSVPKSAILSARTTTLVLPAELVDAKPSSSSPSTSTSTDNNFDKLERSVQTNLTIPTLALALLHEIRRGSDGPFWGYVQSLPRQVEGLPIFWSRDGEARAWLKGTEADRELKRKVENHMGLEDLERFYETTKHLLKPTKTHHEPSPVEAFFYAYSLVSTRAFLIDLYHTLALVPFADILNHSTEHHTSLASDDFVCHICGSLATCTHDSPDFHDPSTSTGCPERLAHLDERTRSKIENEPDTVDMRIERMVSKEEQVMNTYGEGIGNSQLLVEWGFIQDDFHGKGICWDLVEVLGSDMESLKEVWRDVVDRGGVAMELFPDRDTRYPNDDDAGSESQSKSQSAYEDDEIQLISPPYSKDPTLLNLDQEGRISLNIWIAVILKHLPLAKRSLSNLDDTLIASYRSLKDMTSETMDVPFVEPPPHLIKAIETIVHMLGIRIQELYRPDSDVIELLNTRDALGDTDRDRDLYMAMTISIDERLLLRSAQARWEELLIR